jgi:acyl dehydratase
MGKFDEWAGKQLDSGTYSWDRTRPMLYAVGVGAGLIKPFEELQFTTENTSGVDQQVIPTFLTNMAVEGGGWIKELGFPAREWDGYPAGLVHGEQGVSLARPIPVSGTVNLEQVMIGVFDKGSGALCLSETRATLADTGEYLGASRIGLFVRGQGGFGGPRGPEDEQPWVPQERAPDLTVSLEIPVGQSLIYRLLGDVNPHATDPALAKADGFDRPIFFGLGTYGFACRALLKGMCDGDVSRFGGIYGRFSKPVHPGEVLDTHIWHTDGGAQFQTVIDGERVVIDRGQFRYLS